MTLGLKSETSRIQPHGDLGQSILRRRKDGERTWIWRELTTWKGVRPEREAGSKGPCQSCCDLCFYSLGYNPVEVSKQEREEGVCFSKIAPGQAEVEGR